MTKTNRNAFVTGASSGIGKAVTLKLLAEGFAVWGTARSEVRLAALMNHSNFHPTVLDLDDPAGALKAYRDAHAEAAGGFKVVVNNAGYGLFEAFHTAPFAVWEKQIQAMLVTTLRLIQQQVIDLRLRGEGTLVNVASMATEFPLPFMTGYNVAKAGLSAASESLLVEVADTAIRVIDFRPGDFRTDFNSAMTRLSPSLTEGVPAGRMDGAWKALEANFENSPAVEMAAYDLFMAVEKGKRGVVRSGSIFQTKVAPLFERLVPLRWARAVRWHYFGLK